MDPKITKMNKIKNLLLIATLLFSSKSYALEKNLIENKTKKTVLISEIDPTNFTNTAILQSLNKITAKTKKLEIAVGEEIDFGRIDIIVHKCWKAPLHERPENKILLEVFQKATKQDEERKRIFFGWMLSSTPSISSIEHPIYDITAIECIDNNKEEENDS